MSFTVKSFDKIVSDMVGYIISHSSKITDLTPGSVIRSFCEATGLCLEELYVSVYLGFKRQLETFKTDLFGFEKKQGVKATTNLVFTRIGTSGVRLIPIGTRCKTNSGLRFITTVQGEILNGNTQSGLVSAQAEFIGTGYNVPSGSITVLEDDVDEITGVNNPVSVANGIDQESDYSFNNRFQLYIEGLGRSNNAGLLYGALSVDGITSASLVELFPPIGNVNVRLYVDNGLSGGVPADKLAEVQNVIDGNGTEQNPGYRAGGVNVVVLAPGIVIQNIECNISVAEGVDTDQVQLEVDQSISSYMNNLGVGSDIIFNEIVSRIMGVYGVIDCSVTTPSANVTISPAQVGRVGTITITVI